MKKSPLVVASLLATALPGQIGYQGPIPELAVNNSYRVISGTTHPVTGNNQPAVTPPGYAGPPGVVPGTRCWTYTPPVRAQAGAIGLHYLTIEGITQAIFSGPAVTTYPAPNHYAFKTGIAPATPSTYKGTMLHATTGNDIFSVAEAPLVITQSEIHEYSATLATPLVLQATTELLLFAEYKGGEYLNDPNGGQTLACDWQGGYGPYRSLYAGWTIGNNPRTLVQWSSGVVAYRPKIGLLVTEPVLTATGVHAGGWSTTPLAGEEYRGVSAAWAYWTATHPTRLPPNLFFNVRAGTNYGSTGVAVVLLNVGKTFFPGKVPFGGFGNLLLDPTNPALGLVAAMPLVLQANGIYSGDQNPITLAPLGNAAKDTILKAQAIVANTPFSNPQFTTASGIVVF